jgi:hypothetical protein
MKWIGIRKVELKSLVIDDAIRALMGERDTAEMAESLQSTGAEPIHFPVVREADFTVKAGRSRTAAMLLLGAKTMTVRLVEGTDAEMATIEREENVRRRIPDRDAHIVARIAQAEESLPPEDTWVARRKTPRGRAREVVARELGTTPEAIRAAEKREAKLAAPAEPVNLAPPVETWDVNVSHLAQEFAQVRMAQESLRSASRHLAGAQKALSSLRGNAIGNRLADALETQVNVTAALLLRETPTALCYGCKGQLHRRSKCPDCRGFGYVGGTQEWSDDVEPGLLLRGDRARVRSADGAGTQEISEANGKKPPAQKKLKIQDGAGNPIPVDDEGAF